MTRRFVLLAPLAIVGVALFAAIGGASVQWLWNTLMPELFGLHQVTFWQALGLLALSRILFGGFGGRGMHRAGGRHGRQEDRERFRAAVRKRFGLDAQPTSSAD
jgi:hypothetical protein